LVRECAIIEKMVVIPMSSDCQEMEDMGLKRGRQKELKMSRKSFENGSSRGSARTNLTGSQSKRWGVKIH